MYECKGMDEAAKSQLRAAEQAYTAKQSRQRSAGGGSGAASTSGAAAGSKRRAAEGDSSASEPSSKRANVQLTLANFGVVNAKSSEKPQLVGNAGSINEGIAEWLATDALPFSVVSSQYFRKVISLCNPAVRIPGAQYTGCCA